jgi:hypothetical protein
MAQLYWLRLKEHTNVFNDGYVGVTSNFHRRLISHKHRFKDIWDDIIVETLLYGEEDYLYTVEQKLRPTKKIGWNLSSGGYKNNAMLGEDNPNFGKFGEKAPNFKGFWITPLGKFDAAKDAAKVHSTCITTIERRCRGRFANNKFYSPKEGFAFEQKVRVKP